MLFETTCERIRDISEDFLATKLCDALCGKQSRLSRFTETVTAHGIAIAALIRMEPKMAQDAREALRKMR